MESLINLMSLTETYDKCDINIFTKIQDIITEGENIDKLLSDTNEIVINYKNDDLICLNNITIERIDNIINLFIDEFTDFCIDFSTDFCTDKIDDLYEIFINQELSILRLDNLLTTELNNYIKNKKKYLNIEINNLLQKYILYDKIYEYINEYNNKYNKYNKYDLKKYIDEIKNNIFPTNKIYIESLDYDIDDLNKFIQKKYENNIQIIQNYDNFFRWKNNVVLYEINNIVDNNKIYVYIDSKNNSNIIDSNIIDSDIIDSDIIDSDITDLDTIDLDTIDLDIIDLDIIDLDISKVFCIYNNTINNKINNTINNKINNYVCGLIEKYLLNRK